MGKHHKRIIVALAVSLAIGAVAIGGSAFIGRASGAGPESTDNVRVVDDRKLPEQWVINAAYGRGALRNLRAALTEIAKDNAEEARKGVAVAQSLLEKIKRESSTATAELPMKAESTGHLTAEADLILVHSEVRVLGDVDPVDSVQVKLDAIRNEFEMNDHKAIIVALDSLHIPLAYRRIHLPLGKTIALVGESLRALDSSDAEQARSKLLAVGNRLRIETVQVGIGDSPVDPANVDDAG
jgi:hypothetical protein